MIGIASRPPPSGVDVGRGDAAGTVRGGWGGHGWSGRSRGRRGGRARRRCVALGMAAAVGSAEAIGVGELDVAGGTTTPPTGP